MKSTYPTHLRAAVIFISCLAGASLARAEQAAEPPAKKTSAPAAEATADGQDLVALLAELEAATAADQRLALAGKIIALRPAPVDKLKKHLKRTRKSTDEERRKVLEAAGADVPDSNGRFKTPGRETKKVEASNDNFDWLGALVAMPQQNALGEVISDVVVIRALAASKDHRGGTVIVDFAFNETGTIYRDECGRFLRNMSPFSLPALIRGSQNRKNSSMLRYTTYQLERLDRQNPHKAFASAPTEDLQIEIMKAFADSQYREAVFAVLENVNHDAFRVREATRAAWTEYISGKEPPKPPERKLVLPNNKLTNEREPLWLDHRQLADVGIRARIAELTGVKPPKAATLAQLTEQLFTHYDEARRAKLNADFASAMEMASAGKAEEATEVFDRILARHPTFAKRDKMVGAYLSAAAALETQQKWKEASVAYGKANAVAPETPQGQDALKRHHLARAKSKEAAGIDASTELAIAGEIEEGKAIPTESKLLLFAGLAALGGAIVLLILGLTLRRRNPTHAR